MSDALNRNPVVDGLRVLDPGNAIADWDFIDGWVAGSGPGAVYLANADGWKIKGAHVRGVVVRATCARRCFATTIANYVIKNFREAGGEEKTWYRVDGTVLGQTGSAISGNKVFRFRRRDDDAHFSSVGIPPAKYADGMVSVSGNIVRSAGKGYEIGLSFLAGASADLHVLSTASQVARWLRIAP